jgi:hypothetical protein
MFPASADVPKIVLKVLPKNMYFITEMDPKGAQTTLRAFPMVAECLARLVRGGGGQIQLVKGEDQPELTSQLDSRNHSELISRSPGPWRCDGWVQLGLDSNFG